MSNQATTLPVEWREYDVIVVGSGGAGSQAASAAAQGGARVLVVSKDPIACSDTKISEGIATVRGSGSNEDSEQTLSENLRMAGADLPLKSITDAFARDSQQAYDNVRRHGLRPAIDKQRDAPQALPLPMGGHNQRRSVGHENSGVAFGHANWNAIIQSASIDYLEDTWFLDVVTEAVDGASSSARIVGGLMYDAPRGVLVAVRAPAVVIASGGLATLFFPKTDTMRGNTGDSFAIAMRAGADLVDMEQVQFLPFCLASPPSFEGLLCGEPSTASYLGVLRDKDNKIILDSVYLRTRAECASAIMRAVADGRGTPNGGAWLDMTGNKKLPKSGPWFMRFLQSSLPSAYRNARQAMSKAAARCDEPWEVRPSAHYHMGGIRVDEHGASIGGQGNGSVLQGVRGLFAAGQAMGGLFGANRLGSTSLTEGAVFGARAGHAAASLAVKSVAQQSGKNNAPLPTQAFDAHIQAVGALFGQQGGLHAAKIRMQLQQESWRCIGPVRTAKDLTQFAAQLSDWSHQLAQVSVPGYAVWNQAFIELVELRNMLAVATVVAAAARERDVSVGGHVRLDRANASFFAKPYSTVVPGSQSCAGGEPITVLRAPRERTPLTRAVRFKAIEKWRRLQATSLRLMPLAMQDKIIEKRYRALMGDTAVAPEIQAGAVQGAVADANQT